jgi:hypothetical protein
MNSFEDDPFVICTSARTWRFYVKGFSIAGGLRVVFWGGVGVCGLVGVCSHYALRGLPADGRRSKKKKEEQHRNRTCSL